MRPTSRTGKALRQWMIDSGVLKPGRAQRYGEPTPPGRTRAKLLLDWVAHREAERSIALADGSDAEALRPRRLI